MERDLIIDVRTEAVSFALLENHRLVELNKEQNNVSFSVGDVYLGRVKKVMPALNAAFVDIGAAKNRVTDKLDHLADAGVGLRYAKKDDWYAHLDFAHKIDGRDDRSEPGDNDYRIWFQLYKMF